jgi:hypothetical protein
MRGLAEARCPECGCRYEWDELVNREKWVHPFLFEHHPKREYRSFWQTISGGWRPLAFWSSVRPSHAPAPRRLIRYWILTFGSLLLINVALTLVVEYTFPPTFRWAANTPHQANLGPLIALWNQWINCLISNIALRGLAIFTFVMMLWPWLTLAALLVFQISMSRARIRAVHVLRCVIYCADVQLTIAFVALLCSPAILSEPNRFINPNVTLVDYLLSAAWIIAYLIIIGRLMIAYILYLHFSHPVSVVLTAQLMAALFFFVIVNYGLGINAFENVFFGLNDWLYRLHIA